MGYKTRLTIDKLQKKYPVIVSVGYCGAHALMNGMERIGYNKGIYGWNWDAYELAEDTVLITGYRNIRNAVCIDEITDKYEKAAMKAINEWRSEDIAEIRQEFVREIKGLND